jgi:hypothetical protein
MFSGNPILLRSMSLEWLRNFRRMSNMSLQAKFGGRLDQFLPILWKGGESDRRRRSLSDICRLRLGLVMRLRMWLDLSKDEGYITETDCNEIKNRYNRIGAMLGSLWKQWRSLPK